ncbi:MAG: hypothetical protein JNN13_09120 [Planctomycetes bacterium]|nr:hypothetical protein [Planctomycetota bacterium]
MSSGMLGDDLQNGANSSPGGRDAGWVEPQVQPVDLLLGQCQGSEAEAEALRRRIAAQPRLALEVAETVGLLEQFRTLQCEPGPRFASKLAEVVARARRSQLPRRLRLLPNLLVAAAAAVVTFAALVVWQPLGNRAHRLADDPRAEVLPAGGVLAGGVLAEVPGRHDHEGGGEPEASWANSPRPAADARWLSNLDALRRRLDIEASPRLRDAFEHGLAAQADGLQRWLDPRNAMMLRRLDHELRASAELRRQVLARQGGLPAVDDRVQELADGLAAEVMAQLGDPWAEPQVEPVAGAVRAVLAAGPTPMREHAVARAGSWLAERLPQLHGSALVLGLAALSELAATTDAHVELVTEHGRRLLDSLLTADADNWSRRRPELLGGSVAAGVVGEAARLLARLPGFGLDATQCDVARRLLIGQLRERRDRGDDGPEVVAALLFGGAGLFEKGERGWNVLQLQRWEPVRLVPDYGTVQQIAWSVEPGQYGFTRLQRQLRQLALLPAPATMRDRASFCLCLATDYAAFAGAGLRALTD